MGAHACSVLVDMLLEMLLGVEVLLEVEVLLHQYNLVLCFHCHYRRLDPLLYGEVCNPLEHCMQVLFDLL